MYTQHTSLFHSSSSQVRLDRVRATKNLCSSILCYANITDEAHATIRQTQKACRSYDLQISLKVINNNRNRNLYSPNR